MKLPSSSKDSLILKIFVIGFLMLVLFVPTGMIQRLVSEREFRKNEAGQEVASKRSFSQTIAGPILRVPYKKEYIEEKDKEKKITEKIEYAYFLPDALNLDGNLSPEILTRGIYKIVGYTSDLKINGKFSRLNFKELNISEEKIFWENAEIVIALSDTRGIKENIVISWNGKETTAKSGTKLIFASPFSSPNVVMSNALAAEPIMEDASLSGVSAKVPVDPETPEYSYNFSLKLDGSEGIYFAPLGSQTQIKLASSWSTPSFDGAFLPDERTLSEKGFTASWKILELNRNLPQSWVNSNADLFGSSFGTRLLLPVDPYLKTTRTLKYAILVIGLTFLVFFFVEVLNKRKIHPIQYILVGLALVIFYILLLSLSEYIAFDVAYPLAALATILLIALYSKHIFKNNPLTWLLFGILSILYGFIFVIIQLESYALLMGSIGLFITLALVMFISRKIDWYALEQKEENH